MASQDGESPRGSEFPMPGPSRSSPGSIHLEPSRPPMHEHRLTSASIDENTKYRAMIKYINGTLMQSQWMPPPGDPYGGVLLRRSRGVYIHEPERIHPDLLAAVQKIDVQVAFVMATETTKVIFSSLQPQQTELVLPDRSHLQILNSLADVARTADSAIKKFQYAALLRQEQVILIWHDDLNRIIQHANDVTVKMLAMVWGSSSQLFAAPTPVRTLYSSAVNSTNASVVQVPMDQKPETEGPVVEVDPHHDEEAMDSKESLDRPLIVISSISTGMAVLLNTVLLIGINTSNLTWEVLADGNMTRLALIATIPFLMLLSTFFFCVVVSVLFMTLGPIKGIKINSRFYSPVKPNLARAYAAGFVPPRITIQMPVYTESLEGVIQPTITSLKAAISHYESRGGSASIFVNDDGMALLDEDQKRERINFYLDHKVAWVARPKNNDDGYRRKGRFKKASNMNFALNVANKVDDELVALLADSLEKSDMIDPMEEDVQYRRALDRVMASDPRIKAAGDIRIGELILLVDSDTRVPVDCLLYAGAEMFLNPEVAIIQHSTGVLQVAHDYFENGITYFTNTVYKAIRYCVGSGEVAPFVGHNAFLRWKAVQSVGKPDPDGDDYTCYWSESHVSEDFDIALRLQMAGNIVRLAHYHNDEFKEGVSLTIYDELARWEKYAYGCNELVFNPMVKWFVKGPFTKLFLTFLWSSPIPLSSKINILGYICSYYALSASLPLTILNYFLVGWFDGFLDAFYVQSWNVFLALLVIFSGVTNISKSILSYRLGESTIWAALVENFKWFPMMTVFFGGLSFHLNLALLAHMFSINMQWGTTAKEKTDSNFFQEMPKIFKGFKYMYASLIPVVGGMIYLGAFAPRGWEINTAIAVVPLTVTIVAHVLLPLLLNPSLMIFNY